MSSADVRGERATKERASRGVGWGAASCNVQLDAGMLLQMAENLKEVVSIRVALWSEHADQTFRRSADALAERRKANRRLDIVAQNGFPGLHVAGEHCLHAFAQQSFAKSRIAREPILDHCFETSRDSHRHTLRRL